MDAMTPEERFTRIENYLSALAEHQVRHAEEIRELRESHRELRDMHKGLVLAITKVVEAQQMTEAQQRITAQRLDELIKTVDRIIRSRSSN